MATGLECYDALKLVTAELPTGSSFVVNRVEKYDLFKLTVSDLVLRDFDESTAERVSSDLMGSKLVELGKSMGLVFSESPNAPQLIET